MSLTSIFVCDSTGAKNLREHNIRFLQSSRVFGSGFVFMTIEVMASPRLCPLQHSPPLFGKTISSLGLPSMSRTNSQKGYLRLSLAVFIGKHVEELGHEAV
jgi:hypothetical protein